MTRKLKILFHMVDAVGPQNACVGLGQALLERGHEVYMITKTDNRLNGRFTDYGFKVCETKTPEDGDLTDEEAIEEQKKETEGYAAMGIFEDIDLKAKIKKLMDSFLTDEFLTLYESYEMQCREWIEKVKPDLIVADTIGMTPPSLMYSGIPWVLIYCSNPLALYHSEKLPPPLFGFPVNSPPESWTEYRQFIDEHHDGHIAKYQHKLMQKFNYPVPETPEYSLESPYLNLYQFPLELDYCDVSSLPETFCRIDAFCRTELGAKFDIPQQLKAQMKPDDKLIYFSLGSIGTANVKLMNRILAILAKTPYYFIVSKGVFQEEIILGSNMWGDRYVPQTKILPIVDAAIIHGGNNSLTESIHFGVPIIVMPIFYDQLDNGQRIQEKGFGLKVDPYRFTDNELLQALETVLNDGQLKVKLAKASKRIAASQSKVKACIAMENVVENFGKK